MTHIDTVDTVDTSLGNTITNDSKSRGWVFTLNNYSDTETHQILEYCKSNNKKYIFGKEVGDEKGTPHLQGYIYSKNAIRFSTLKKICRRWRIKPAKGSMDSNYNYCSKEGDFETNIDPPKKKKLSKDEKSEILEQKRLRILENDYKPIEWRDWQKKCIDVCNSPKENRKIYWLYEKTGNVGKSFLTRYLYLKYGGILCGGKRGDVFNQCMTYDIENNHEDPNLVLCDIPRTSIDYVDYGCLEKIKDRLLFSGKYEGGVIFYEQSPHIICYANELPNKAKMSSDRWEIINIGGEDEDEEEDEIINI